MDGTFIPAAISGSVNSGMSPNVAEVTIPQRNPFQLSIYNIVANSRLEKQDVLFRTPRYVINSWQYALNKDTSSIVRRPHCTVCADSVHNGGNAHIR